jgi:hypothetical protein
VDGGTFILGGPGGPDASGVLVGGEPPKRRGWIAGVLVLFVVLAVLAASGAGVVLYRKLSGGGPQPDKYAPASSFAFGKIDLDPSAGEKIAAYRFSRKFHGSITDKAKNADDLRDRLLRQFFTDSEPPTDYDKDVKPWLGDRAGAAGFMDQGGKPQAVLILQVKDKGKARTSLKRLSDEATADSPFAYNLPGDYVVIGDTQVIVDEAVNSAKKSNLGDNAHFSKDVDTLGGGQIVTAWADLPGVQKALGDAFPDLAGGLDLFTPALFATISGVERPGVINARPVTSSLLPTAALRAGTSTLTGRAVLGVHVASNHVDLRVRQIGSKVPSIKPGSVRDMVTKLPDETAAAVAVSGLTDALTSLTKGTDNLLDQALAPIGLTAKDITDSLGDTVVAVLGNTPDEGDEPLVAVRTRPLSQRAVDRTLAVLRENGIDVVTTRAGGDLILSTNKAYADKVSKGGALGNNSRFKSAIGSTDGTIVALGYVDVRRFLQTLSDKGGTAKPITAVGFVVTQHNDVQEIDLRVVAD